MTGPADGREHIDPIKVDTDRWLVVLCGDGRYRAYVGGEAGRALDSPWWNPVAPRAVRRPPDKARVRAHVEHIATADCYAVRPNNAVRRGASPLECSRDFHHGLLRVPGPRRPKLRRL